MKQYLLNFLLALCSVAMTGRQLHSASGLIAVRGDSRDFELVKKGVVADILVDSADSKTVLLVAGLFADDVQRVTGLRPVIRKNAGPASQNCVIAGTIGSSSLIRELIDNKKIDVTGVKGHWESCLIEVVDHPFEGVGKALVIAGSDRRGTAYGLLELSKQIGVSPWYYFADVAIKKQKEIIINAGRQVMGSPSVKYRGIFINDEMWGIRPWAEQTLAPSEGKGLGPTTYRKVFELLLRLKANCLWPAMHARTIPFNFYEGNKVAADEYGIVMGSSHIEPMLRNNMGEAEWDREYPGEPFDYVTNREHIYLYWEERVKTNGKYENIYTLGKRGKDDEPGKEVTVPVLNQIIDDQRSILKKWVNEDVTKVPQVLIPYTEVLDMYNKGLKVPDDIIICWPDDNFGNIRQLPDKKEQLLSGGSGVYYHFQWLNGATTAYPWLFTTPLGLTWSEMQKAYDYKVDQLWMVNVGDIKPAEIGIEFFMQMAWNIKEFSINNPGKFLVEWASRDFGEKYAARIAAVMEKHFELGYARRPEHMVMSRRDTISWEWFSLKNYNDEAQQRIDAYDQLVREAEGIYESLPREKKDAFFEMVLYNVKCAGLQNIKVINAQRSNAYGKARRSSAALYAKAAREAEQEIRNTIEHYNKGLLTVGSKWNHMASLPGPWGQQWRQWDMPSLSDFDGEGPPELHVSLEGGDTKELPGFSVYSKDKRFLDIFNSGTGRIRWKSSVSDNWIKLSAGSGEFDHEKRIWVTIDWEKVPTGRQVTGSIGITGAGKKCEVTLSVFNPPSPSPEKVKGFADSNGCVSMEAQHYTKKTDKGGASWTVIEGLGRTGKAVTVLPATVPCQASISELSAQSPCLEYDMYLFSTDTLTSTFYCTPSKPINGDYKSRIAVAFDDEKPQIVSSLKGKSNVIDNLMTIDAKHFIRSEGQHKLKIWMVDPGIVIDKIVINTGGVKASYLGPPESFFNRETMVESSAKQR